MSGHSAAHEMTASDSEPMFGRSALALFEIAIGDHAVTL